MIKRLQGSFLIVVFFSLFLLAGCYHATIDTGLAPGPKTVEMWKHSWIVGLVPPSVVEAQSECENGVARVETQQSFLNGLINVLTGGIYTPMTVIVTCTADDMSSAAVDSASVVAVPYGSDDEEIMDAFGQAADKAVAAEQPAYVQFADRTPSSKPTGKKMSLHDAAEEGILDRVRFLVEDGADVNAHYSERESTPLHVAAKGGHLEVVRFLVGNGADVNARKENGETPLHGAAFRGERLEAVRLLIENGADVNARGTNRRTPLGQAAFCGDCLEVVRLLIENGADVNTHDESAASTSLHVAAGGGHLDVVHFLVESGAYVNALGSDGRTPLYFAALKGDIGVVRFLVENGADVNPRSFRITPLGIALMNEHEEVANYLCSQGSTK